MSGHVYRPASWVVTRTSECPTCKRRRRFTVWLYLWFDPDSICWGCGEHFNADGWVRPFSRGWRETNKAYARRAWAKHGRTWTEALRQMSAAIGAEDAFRLSPKAAERES